MPAPITISSPSFQQSPSYDEGGTLSHSLSHLSGGGMRSPTSPRPSFLPSFMRRPRAATGESVSRPAEGAGGPPSSSMSHPALARGPPSPQPQPSSSESLQSPSTPPHPTLGPRRRTTTQPPPSPGGQGGMPSPPLSSSARDDPLAGFGHRLLRRISNHGGSTVQPVPGQGLNGHRPASAGAGAVGGGGRTAGTPPALPAVFGQGQQTRQGDLDPTQPQTDGSAGPPFAPTSTIIITNPSNPIGPTDTSGLPASSSLQLLPPIPASAPLLPSGPSSATPEAPVQRASTSVSSPSASSSAATHRLRLVPLLDASHSLPFDPVVRDVRESAGEEASAAEVFALKIGRFTDKQSGADGTPRGGALSSTKVAFKSKVVSRCHAEVWAVAGGKFFVKDTKSSSGTFLNHIRLSPPSHESKPFAIKDGDVIQLGVDYQGGTEEIYRCVKMKVELGRGWQSGANEFNTNALKQLNALRGDETGSVGKEKSKKAAKVNVTDCVICLFQVTICQSLFIAPCSHVFHYKCIRPLLALHHPGFSCPVCRSFADLEADVETEDEPVAFSRRESLISRKGSLKSVKQAFEQALGNALHAGADDDDEDEEAADEFVQQPLAEPSRAGLRPFGSPVGQPSTLAALATDGAARPESSGRPDTAVAPPTTADLGYSPSRAGFGDLVPDASVADRFVGQATPTRGATLLDPAATTPLADLPSQPTLPALPPTDSPVDPLDPSPADERRTSSEEGGGPSMVSSGSPGLAQVEEVDVESAADHTTGEAMVRRLSLKDGLGQEDDGEGGSTGGSSSGAGEVMTGSGVLSPLAATQ